MNEIKSAREAAGLTQKMMSEIMSIPILTISAWEIGRREPPPYVKRFVLKELAAIAQKNK